ncbi:histidine phosphatase family protein [Luteipulveratus sp. YIM 133132]|uniref:histidine phosphatase family protein n=1 Tax=Luteipulveratus flavus TaxID=3031728 RepID=UPI0023B10D68|nr:histidine phosphatase family protein [Luteipulveratus sp. YIM 133132]MDE9366145.1 histidine phosphatase family protein [Luteipulveratus sp. YIM 133132]
MSVVLLVRHGQASFGKRDYDVLSDRGHEQAALLGRALAGRGVRPARVVHGGMRRQADTAAGVVEAADWQVSLDVDERWAEFDHEDVIHAYRPAYRRSTVMKADLARTLNPQRAFRTMFAEATTRWSSGEHAGYVETFASFTARAEQALRAAADGEGTTVVVTSGGVIGVITARLLAGDLGRWGDINAVAVNSGVTKVISGSSGLTLVSFNAHDHLESDPASITYR